MLLLWSWVVAINGCPELVPFNNAKGLLVIEGFPRSSRGCMGYPWTCSQPRKVRLELDMYHGEISQHGTAIRDKIHTSFRQLGKVLEDRKTELVSQQNQMTQEKLNSLQPQKDQIETTLVQLRSCSDSIRENLKTVNKGDALRMKKSLVKQIKELPKRTS